MEVGMIGSVYVTLAIILGVKRALAIVACLLYAAPRGFFWL